MPFWVVFQKIMNQYKDEIIMLVEYDAKKYARQYKTKAVKKTFTIPQWLDEEATANRKETFCDCIR